MSNKDKDIMESNPMVQDEAPMAVLPLNPSAKLDQEPNPFEKSFSGASVEETSKDKLKLPPVAAITSPSQALIVNNNDHNNSNSQPQPQTNVIGGGVLPKEISNQFTWETLRTGPLSPSMLQGPANPDEYYSTATTTNGQLAPPNIYSSRSSFTSTANPIKMEAPQPIYMNTTQYHQYQPNPYPHAHLQQQQQQLQEQSIPRMRQSSTNSQMSTNTTTSNSRKRSFSHQEDDGHSIDSNESNNQPQNKSRRRSSAVTNNSEEDQDKNSNSSSNGGGGGGRKKSKSTGKSTEDDEKRRNFLERNRIAALKCRQRKKQWLNNLQAKVEFLTSDNERLQIQSESLKEEIVNLKTLLLAHKDCPIAQANGFHPNSIQKAMPSMLSTQQMMRQGIPPPPMPPSSTAPNSSTLGMIPAPPTSFLNNRTSTTNTATTANTSASAPPPPPVSTTTSNIPNSIPQYQRATTTMGIPVPPQQTSHQQQSMVAGGSSNVLRF